MKKTAFFLAILWAAHSATAQITLHNAAGKIHTGKGDLIRQADGSLIYVTSTGGSFYSGRLLPNGDIDDTFNGIAFTKNKREGLVHSKTLAARLDKWGRLLIAGSSCVDSNSGKMATLIRLDKSGNPDVDFLPGIVQLKVEDSSEFIGVHVEPGERIMTYGVCYKEGRAGFFITRRMYNGDEDKSFGTNGVITDFSQPNNNIPVTTTVQTDGKLVVASHNNGLGDNKYDIVLSRYFPNGIKDSTYNFSMVFPEHSVLCVKSMLIQAGNRVVIAGEFLRNNGNRDIFIRAFTEGNLCDTTFGEDGWAIIDVTNDDRVDDIISLPDGRLLLSGAGSVKGEKKYSRYLMLRFSPDGKEEKGYGYGAEGGFAAAAIPKGYTVLSHNITVSPLDGKVYRLSELVSDNETETVLTFTTYLQDSALGFLDIPRGKLQNFVYPIPVNRGVTFSFDLVEDMDVSIKLHDVSGRELATVVNKRLYVEGENAFSINFPANWKPGKYLVILSSDMGYRITVEITKI